MHIQLYIAAGLFILVPVTCLVILHFIHRYRFTAVVGGIAAYFVSTQLLIPLLSMMMATIGMGEEFWLSHMFASEVMNVFLNSILHDLMLFVILKFTLKKRSRIYDAAAMGISFWLADSLRYALSTATYARVYQMSEAGRLSEMVTETTSMEMLNSALNDIVSAGISAYYVQLFSILSLTALSIALCLFFYLSVKRRTGAFLLMGMGAHLLLLLAVDLALYFGGSVWYIVTNALVLVLSAAFIWRFMVWYREQQRALALKKKEYKQNLKSSPAPDVKSAAESTEEETSEEASEEASEDNTEEKAEDPAE